MFLFNNLMYNKCLLILYFGIDNNVIEKDMHEVDILFSEFSSIIVVNEYFSISVSVFQISDS